jgi:rhodanese-related sulfurtransferase
MIPEITTVDLAEKMKTGENFILLDVREPVELGYAKIEDSRLEVTPMSRLAEEGLEALSDSARSQEAVIYVLCHHGNRSGQVAMWLSQQGWKNVFSVAGGIDDYARRIDRSVGMY